MCCEFNTPSVAPGCGWKIGSPRLYGHLRLGPKYHPDGDSKRRRIFLESDETHTSTSTSANVVYQFYPCHNYSKDITATYCLSIVNGKENRVWKPVWNIATEHNIIQLEGEGKARPEAHNPTATPSKARGRKEDKHRRNKPRSDSSTR